MTEQAAIEALETKWCAENVLYLIELMIGTGPYTGFPCWVGGAIRKWREGCYSSLEQVETTAKKKVIERGNLDNCIERFEDRTRAALQSKPVDVEGEKIAPVQGFSAGIPWDMHLRAYDAYCDKYGKQHALIDLEGRNCRGGFGTGELDDFIPNWRDELESRRLNTPQWQHMELAKKLVMEVHTFNDGLVSELDLGQKVVEIAKEYKTQTEDTT